MKKFDFGQTITILANLGVIAGIIFFAIEIQQNNALMRSQTRSEISQSISGLLLTTANSPYVGDIVAPEDVASSGDIAGPRFHLREIAKCRIWENVYYYAQRGLYEQSEYEGERAIWASDMGIPSIRQHFCDYRGSFSAGFD